MKCKYHWNVIREIDELRDELREAAGAKSARFSGKRFWGAMLLATIAVARSMLARQYYRYSGSPRKSGHAPICALLTTLLTPLYPEPPGIGIMHA